MRTVIDRDSIEYLRVPVTSPTNTDLSTVPMQLAVTHRAVRPDEGDWSNATWDAVTSEAFTLVGPFTEPGDRNVWLRLTDNPEIPVIDTGVIRVT